ncbi:uncharacterized protein LOC129717590 isoform X2 [Wyeomyia smithii]|uniref:uncharacterized protein LOC129717590 isoform X2 n=1 Tax=Wyeomyia smithii TaxID=174621 RepID=UPI002467E5F4|nr:uncharacterized protein LOC129717590 isoform X2 [Wyeomyia smithii]
MGEAMGDGKRFLEGLILRAEDVLGKMIFKMHHTEVPLEEMVPWINSVYAFVNAWEAPLQDIKIDQLKRDAAASSRRHAEDALIEEMNQQLDCGRSKTIFEEEEEDNNKPQPRGAVVRLEEAEPVFDFLERSLKDYSPGKTGVCFITNVLPSDNLFDMLDRSAADGQRADHMLKTLQNVTVRLSELPTKTGVVFGVELEGELFRAVHNRLPALGMVTLKLLDTGEVLPYADSMTLYELSEYYQSFRSLAVRCRFVGRNGKKAAKNIPQYLRDNMYVNMKYEVHKVDGSVLHVSLEAAEHRGIMKRMKRAEETAQAVPEYKISEKTLTAEERAILYEDTECTTNAMKATMGFVPKDDSRICPHYDPKIEGCFKGSRCQLQHVAKDPDGWTRDRELHKGKIRAMLLEPAIGSEHPMIPTAIVSVQEFYGQLLRPETVVALSKLQAQLNDEKMARSYRKMDHKPYTREYVLALYQREWYRAEVIEYYDDQSIEVFYVDYGNYERVSIDDLRLWDDRFDYLPLQAIHCRLANISPKENADAAKQALEQAICDKRVVVRVLDIRAYWEVLVFDEQGADVGAMLVDRNVGLPRQPLVFSDRNGFVPA